MGKLYQSEGILCEIGANGVAEVTFDHPGSVNKFDQQTIKELSGAVAALQQESQLKGVLFKSAKDAFIVGADIMAFTSLFKADDETFSNWLQETHQVFNQIEDLNVPTLSAINGFCFGGGCEMTLATTFRVMSDTAKIGLPEVKLGIYPGWGGTIRLPRLIGADNAIEWIAGGEQYKAAAALQLGVVDAVTSSEDLLSVSRQMLKDAIEGQLHWESRAPLKKSPMTLRSPIEAGMVFEGAKGFVAAKAGPHYPAPILAIEAMQKGAACTREQAMPFEIAGFMKAAKTPAAESLISIFLSDQFNKKKNKKQSSAGEKVKKAAVLGAGIMGGGVAYQAASRGLPILMKDIHDDALNLGMQEANKLFVKQVERGKLKHGTMAEKISHITPTCSYGDFKGVNLVIEAVTESEKIKNAVLAEVESQIDASTVLTSNTSTISISKLAQKLKHPERFCGMHFFNPVHRMPLVEVIRGEKSSPEAIATTVACALQMGKTPIVVGDCPGFLVNRVLFPYLQALDSLLQDGVHFQRIDKVMEKFGWPMGPAYLMDVVGHDTAQHAMGVMAEGYPDRMQQAPGGVIEKMVNEKRYGQKNGRGFYRYEMDRKGKPKKVLDTSVDALLGLKAGDGDSVSDEQIVDRMMLPMLHESVRCLQEGIVATPQELDLALIYGLGFPPFRGGILKWADHVGHDVLLEKAQQYQSLGKVYEPVEMIQKFAKSQGQFYRMEV
ncbi:MAG: fatty acid oxidation complex subunit alpha FadB [Oligoflexales bacterium]